MTSATSSLEIKGVKDRDVQTGPTSRSIKIEGENKGKEKGTAPEAHTEAPEQLACPAVSACCKCGTTLTCKAARCECRKAACALIYCRCLGQCANVAPQTRHDGQQTKGRATTWEMGTGKRKRQNGRARG